MKSREYIVDTLYRVLYDGGYANIILRNMPADFNDQDRRFITEVVYGTLRNYLLMEYQWKDFITSPVKNRTSVILAMSVYQLFFLYKIPSYAVINEAVEIADVSDKVFVNAILHKVEERGLKKPDIDDELERLSIENSHPLWIVRLLNAHYGLDTTRDILTANQSKAIVYGRVNTLLLDIDEIENDSNYEIIDQDCVTYKGNITQTDYFKEGKIIIQDYSSQLVARKLEVQDGMRVLDCCSAPGTKTQQIATYMHNNGEIIANDVTEKRTNLITNLMNKTGIKIVKTSVADATVPNDKWKPESFDRILIDAPCSGLGDLRHKPEIRYNLQPTDIDELVVIQEKILESMKDYLKVGGILVYSTCTLNHKENERQVANFLKRNNNFKLSYQETIFPFQYQSDGFYIAQLEKVSIK